jgi:methylmalonyl-CoA/ethylmalonyl-CoA epimerase
MSHAESSGQRPAGVADRITRVDHVAIAVLSIAETIPLFCGALGATFITGGDNDETGLRLMHLQLPGLKLELLAPLRDDTVLSRNLERRGPGFHHMTFFVDDVPATVELLEADGFPVTGTNTVTPAWSESFIKPSASFGALLQFVSSTRPWGEPASDFELEDVLAGRVVWQEYIACLRADR